MLIVSTSGALLRTDRLEAGDNAQIEAVRVRVVLARNRRQAERAVIHPKLQRASDRDLRPSSNIPETRRLADFAVER
jgi:hypothetical protein